jgi:hypothetical protein
MSKPKDDIDHDYLKSIVIYNPDNGLFEWKNKKYKSSKKHIGYVSENGYVIIDIHAPNNARPKKYRAHRLAWLYFYGEWPKNDIDHINGDRTDNRIINLRDITRRQNLQNMEKHRNGKLPGATRVGEKWQSQIQKGKETFFLGMYETELEAHLAYRLAEKSIEGIV